MEHTKLALSAVMIVAVGLIGTNFVTGLEMTGQEKFDALSNSNVIYGHITLVHSDPDGNVLAYIQTDNTVALIGLDCMAEKTFGDLLTRCTIDNNNSIFDTIALFNGESFPVTMNATGFDDVGGEPTKDTGNGLLETNGGGTGGVDIIAASLGITAGTVTVNANATAGTGTKIDITNTFTLDSGTQVVDGAVLASNDQSAILAGQTFDTVTLNQDDTLAITWTITIGSGNVTP